MAKDLEHIVYQLHRKRRVSSRIGEEKRDVFVVCSVAEESQNL